MTVIRTAALLVACLTLATACGDRADGNDTAPASAPDPTSESVTASPPVEWTGATIPDGRYRKTSTAADAERLGIPPRRAKDYLGDDGEMEVELVIKGDAYAQLTDDDDEVMVQGDGGTVGYDEDGRLVAISASSGCPGCTATVAWTVKRDQLTLEIIDSTEDGDPVDLLVSRLVFEGTYTRR
jgi:hypothetical protein